VRVLELQLIAWGGFSDRRLDLSNPSPGLHLVYGPNEAGKSTALRGLRALLYGVPERTDDDFVHRTRDLRIGAVLERSDGSRIAVVRRKGRGNTLLAADGSALPDEALAPFLGGIHREAFCRHFGLDHDDLVAGGRELLDEKGELGSSLFAAAAGSGQLRRLLKELREDAEKLFKPSAQNPEINRLIRVYREERERVRQASLRGQDWDEHYSRLQEHHAGRARTSGELAEISTQLARLARLEQAMPLVSRRAQLLRERAGLGEVLLLPEDFGTERKQAVEAIDRARRSRDEAQEEASRIRERLGALVVREEVLREEARINELHQSLGDYRKTSKDLPKRRAEMAAAMEEAVRTLADLQPGMSLEQAESLRPGVAERHRIRTLSTERGSIMARLESAGGNLQDTVARLERSHRELAGLGPARDAAELKALLRRTAAQGDLERLLSDTRARFAAATGGAASQLKALPLWTGSLEELEALQVPAEETVVRHESTMADGSRVVEQLRAQMADRRQQQSDLDRKIETLRAGTAVPTEAELTLARDRREKGWALVRANWLEGKDTSAAAREFDGSRGLDRAFEGSVRQADDVADRLRHEAERVAQHATWAADRDRLRAECEALGGEIARAVERVRADVSEWKGLWAATGIDALLPAEMRTWLRAQRALAETARVLREQSAEIARVESRIRETREEAGAAVERLGEPGPRDGESCGTLLERSRTIVDRIEGVERSRKELNRTIDELAGRRLEQERALEDAEEDRRFWEAEWDKLARLPGRKEPLPPDVANDFLDRVDRLFEQLGKVEDLRKRIAKMERDASALEDEARLLAAAVASELKGDEVESILRRLWDLLTRALQDRTARTAQTLQLEAQDAAGRRAELSLRQANERLAELCRTARCADPGELEPLERLSSRARELDSKTGDLERQLAHFTGGGTLEDLVRETAEVDPDQLPARTSELKDRAAALETERMRFDQGIGQEEEVLRQMDGSAKAAEAAEEAQRRLAELQRQVDRYVELRAAAELLEAGLEAYRKKNQAPVLRMAGEMFQRLTLGSFAGLRTEYDDKDQPLIAGVRPGETIVRVEGMSDGTRDQLFLALRLATIELHLGKAEPVPLVLDDVLLNFDDNRSRATLKVLAELSGRVQVLFFTHHAHLVELARASVPEGALRVHSL
jgi:uncharacterized protein YhaN